MSITPSKGDCMVAMAFQIELGQFGSVSLDDLGFIVIGRAPEVMNKGNWEMGIVVDERANEQQRDAIGAIARGTAGGPMAALSGLVGKFLGMQSASIHFDRHGHKWTVKAAGAVEVSASGVIGVSPDAREPIHFEYAGHPVADRLAIAHPSGSHIHALGLTWDDISGMNSAQYAPFAWKSA
jgi:hypothetical protein